jgi:hypothetical protein
MYEPLAKEYLDELDGLAKEVQESPELAKYLDEEEEEDYGRLKEIFEPRIGLLYDRLSEKDPLQIIEFERRLLKEDFEGLYLPKILGYSVLRGELNEHSKYKLPQEHFKAVLMAICDSMNFDILKKRIGQSIQMGFAFSSDIWVTNLITPITNKKVRYYLQGQKLPKYRDIATRKVGYARYKKQFKDHNFMTAQFPQTVTELNVYWSSLKLFLIYRINLGVDNSSFIPHLRKLIENPDFQGTQEHLEILFLYTAFFNLEDADFKHLVTNLERTRETTEDFATRWLQLVLNTHNRKDIDLSPAADQRISAAIDKTRTDKLSEYYKLMDVLHTKGYAHDEAQEAVKVFYNQYQGLSLINECVRKTVFNYIHRVMSNIGVGEYPEWFKLTRIFTTYVGIFVNQKFNQDVKDLFMAYVRKLLKKYTDKRGKDYQDIKKFVSTTFQDLKFLSEKQVVELFKTRRKRKTPAAAAK